MSARCAGAGSLGALLLLIAAGCSRQAPEPPPSRGEPAEQRAAAVFQDITAASGIDFTHDHGGSGRKYLVEIMGAGGCALDYDGDGWTDLYLVQSGWIPGTDAVARSGRNRLFRGLGNGAFVDVTAAAEAGDTGHGMGAACADYDNDGHTDIFVVNFGLDALLRNNGDGSFADVTAAAGIDSPLWGSSATFFDADGDGWLDLYVANYLDFTVDRHVDCGRPSQGILSYCHPDVYEMAPDVFFRNRGDGSFEELTAGAGLTDTSGKGLGVVAADLTGDGWPDLYVANDATPNFLYRNLGDGAFEEAGLYLGVSHNEEGKTEAGMGTDVGDVNGDGWLDIFVTNLSNETNALYLGGEALFTYATRSVGLHAPSYLFVGFGTDLLDLDNDGDQDIVVTNGHVIDNIELTDDAQTFRQPGQVFVNDGRGNFRQLPADSVGELSHQRVGRGTITLDHDHDGRLDLLVTYNNDAARLFHNRWPAAGGWLQVQMSVGPCARPTVGARATVTTPTTAMVDETKVGSSYQTSGDPRLHFGLGDHETAERLTVRWPGGLSQSFRGLPAGHRYLLARPCGPRSGAQPAAGRG